jgi:FkbM family methyltransferase
MTAFAIDRLPGEPFDLVLDVGGNVGGFAEQAVERWPGSHVVSFEPVPQLADSNVARAAGRWTVERIAVSDRISTHPLYVCENQHTASTMQEPGTARRREFGIVDSFAPIRVETMPLDAYLWLLEGRERVLVKVDVEGHEGVVLAGAGSVLGLASCVVVECQQDPSIFIDSPSPGEVDAELRRHGLAFAGITDALRSPAGRVMQFDGVWSRAGASP